MYISIFITTIIRNYYSYFTYEKINILWCQFILITVQEKVSSHNLQSTSSVKSEIMFRYFDFLPYN